MYKLYCAGNGFLLPVSPFVLVFVCVLGHHCAVDGWTSMMIEWMDGWWVGCINGWMDGCLCLQDFKSID